MQKQIEKLFHHSNPIVLLVKQRLSFISKFVVCSCSLNAPYILPLSQVFTGFHFVLNSISSLEAETQRLY